MHQLRDVLRLKIAELVTVLDDSGWEYTVCLTSLEREQASGQVEHKALTRTEPRAKLTLYQSMLKGQNLEWVLQKGTEVGIVEFVPIVSDRCVISSLDDVSKSKFERWQRIIVEAAEQSHRGHLPRLQPPMLFPQACERARNADLALVPWEGETTRTLRSVLAGSYELPQENKAAEHRRSVTAAQGRKPFSIHIFIGPEGGFTHREVDQARRYGLLPVTLGPRILRAETAGLVAATMVLYHLEDLS